VFIDFNKSYNTQYQSKSLNYQMVAPLPSRLLPFCRTAGIHMGFKFQNFDFLNLDSSFSEDELLVRRSAREFVEDNIVPIIEDCFREGRFPRELVPLMGEMGFFGANLEGYGCAGMSNVEYGLVTQELERGDSGLRSFVSVQSALVMYPIYTFGSEDQKKPPAKSSAASA